MVRQRRDGRECEAQLRAHDRSSAPIRAADLSMPARQVVQAATGACRTRGLRRERASAHVDLQRVYASERVRRDPERSGGERTSR
jgi:hypothetical protein